MIWSSTSRGCIIIQTLTDANASWWEKGLALGDLTASIIMDINMLDGAGEAMQAARIGAQIAEKGAIDVSEMAGKDAAKVVEGCVGGGLSFIFATKVATQQGEQAIGTLKVGAKVWAYNPSTKKMELQPILHVWINHDNDLIDLSITKTIKQGKTTKPVREVLHTNQKHPFLTVEKGFVPVGQITLGMHIVEANGQVGIVSGWKVVPGVKVMYNLEVAQDHTFVVGVGMWVVHNCDENNWIKNLPKDPQTLIDEGWQDVTHPQAKANTSSISLNDPSTGRNVRFDKGVPGDPGFGGKDHYHVYNPNSTGKGDLYLDIYGNGVPRNSSPSHILPGR